MIISSIFPYPSYIMSWGKKLFVKTPSKIVYLGGGGRKVKIMEPQTCDTLDTTIYMYTYHKHVHMCHIQHDSTNENGSCKTFFRVLPACCTHARSTATHSCSQSPQNLFDTLGRMSPKFRSPGLIDNSWATFSCRRVHFAAAVFSCLLFSLACAFFLRTWPPQNSRSFSSVDGQLHQILVALSNKYAHRNCETSHNNDTVFLRTQGQPTKNDGF